MTLKEAFAALVVCVMLVVSSGAEKQPAYQIPYFMPPESTLANYTQEQLEEHELTFLKEKAGKRGYRLVKIRK